MGQARRWAGASLGACLLQVVALLSGAQATVRYDGPFNVLEWADGVSTSRSGYAVWVSIGSTTHRARIPGYAREVGPPAHRAALGVSCRAPGSGLPDRFPLTAAHGEIFLDNHSEHPGVYQVWHPMHWILELSGRAEDRWPVEVRIGSQRPLAATLVRSRTDYSAPHPGLHISLPGAAVLDAILEAGPIEVSVRGQDIAVSARFTASANARRAAALMRTACPSRAPESGQ